MKKNRIFLVIVAVGGAVAVGFTIFAIWERTEERLLAEKRSCMFEDVFKEMGEGYVAFANPIEEGSNTYRQMVSCSVPREQLTGNRNLREQYLRYAASGCKSEEIKKIISAGDICFEANHFLVGTLLHTVTGNRREPRVIELFLNKGIPLEARSMKGKGLTALGFAVRGDNAVATKALLEAGADPEVRYGKFDTLKEYCMEWEEGTRAGCEVVERWVAEPQSGEGETNNQNGFDKTGRR